jgi:uncharacterized protein (TIGR03435 family)
MRRCLSAAVALMAVAGDRTIAVQQQSNPGPSFEVASIKIADPELRLHRGLVCGALRERFSAFGWFRYLVACAYGINDARLEMRILGGPRWIDDDFYVIEARVPQDAVSITQERAKLMLRALLAERFKLSVHEERREAPTLKLVVARKDGKLGPNLQPTPKACADWIAGGRQGPPPVLGDLTCVRGQVSAFAIRGAAMPLSQLVNQLSGRTENPVIDATGLTGSFAVDLRWRPEQSRPDATFSDDLPTSVFTALQEQLGLKLEPSKSVVNLLVIDRVERPTPN